jgi:hypothetical protein
MYLLVMFVFYQIDLRCIFVKFNSISVFSDVFAGYVLLLIILLLINNHLYYDILMLYSDIRILYYDIRILHYDILI